METKSLTKVKLIAVILVLAFLFTGCGPKATFKHPDDAAERFLSGEDVVGLTIKVHTNPDREIAEYDSALGVIYNQGYKGSLMKKLLIFVEDGQTFGANETHVVRIVSIHETRTGDIYINGTIVD